MTSITTKSDSSQLAAETASRLFDNWFDPIETEVRARSRQFIEELIRSELDDVLARPEVTSALKYRNTSRTIGMVNGTWFLAEAANACIPEQSGATSEMRAEMVAS